LKSSEDRSLRSCERSAACICSLAKLSLVTFPIAEPANTLLKVTHLIEHKAELTEKEPVKYKPYPMQYKIQEVVDKEVGEMLKVGTIKHS